MAKQPTRSQAIHAFCRMCIVDPGPGNGTWKQQTEACAVTSCPLHPYRPLSQGTKKDHIPTKEIN